VFYQKKLLKKAELKNHYFDQNLNLYIIQQDSNKKFVVKKIFKNDHFSKPKGMGHFIVSMGSQDKWTTLFTDLLERIFILDPNKRLTVVEALNHPFISEQ
jgi:serine/threonine-protein kinase PRP4